MRRILPSAPTPLPDWNLPLLRRGGRLTADANPNGSARNIAGICNAARNVLGLMSHPERCAEAILGNAPRWPC